MTTKPEHGTQSSNVIHFRPKQAAFRLPDEPSREELAFDWTLSEADKRQVLSHRQNDNQLRFAVQLCVLRKYGRFLDSYRRIPANVLGYLCRQLEMTPAAELSFRRGLFTAATGCNPRSRTSGTYRQWGIRPGGAKNIFSHIRTDYRSNQIRHR